MKSAEALGSEEPLVARDIDEAAYGVSPDGRWLALREYHIETGEDLVLARVDEPSDIVPVASTPFEENSPSFSRDSAWIAFRSYASGRSEVYVQRVPDGMGRVRVSSSGGTNPVWSPTRDELYYVSGDELMAVGYSVSVDGFTAQPPRPILDLPRGHRSADALDISPDGRRFLIVVDTGEDPPPTELRVTRNWFEELNRVAPPTR
ncbi:MAG TPA: hypothetical protein VLK65_13370 [Vicinamibacteria bacterium]|nr:hypothetical protein [Vicinamibacteria bacterium]